jgi:poly-beta-1,6-N-acetyl-D-glucosamine N-deacetylase
MNTTLHRVRNVVCGGLALALIASGRVRRARRRALQGGVVTAVYFHKPNRRLFLRSINWLERHGYKFITARELVAFARGQGTVPPGAVWLSFDDGCRELLTDVLPLVRERHIPVTLFVPSGIIEGDGRFYWISEENGQRHSMTAAELRESSCWPEVTIGSHTVSHAIVVGCTREQFRFELAQSKQALERLTGSPVELFAYPNGDYDAQSVQLIEEAGYTLGVTVKSGFVEPGVDMFLAPRFSVADNITYPEAIANLVGVWRPFIDPVKYWLRPLLSRTALARPASARAKVTA